jgi:hypothetical protein
MARTLVKVGSEIPLLDLRSFGRWGPDGRLHLSPAFLEQIVRTASRAPEVMVKVSGGAHSTRGAIAHLKYIAVLPRLVPRTRRPRQAANRAHGTPRIERVDQNRQAPTALLRRPASRCLDRPIDRPKSASRSEKITQIPRVIRTSHRPLVIGQIIGQNWCVGCIPRLIYLSFP